MYTTSQSGDSPPDITSGASLKESNGLHPARMQASDSTMNMDPDFATAAHLHQLNKKVKQSINQMMKEQRSLSVGSLPGNLKSHILKTI